MMESDNNQNERVVGDYVLGRKIGSGSFAVVWKGKHKESGREVAVKEIEKKVLSPKVSENLRKEVLILSTINHPNIIRLFDSIETEDQIFLVLEYCDGGDLAGYMHRHGKVTEAVAKHFMRQLASGLQVLHEKHVIHRDLKPQNLLLSSKEVTPQLKIGDFGFARSVTPQDLANTLCGSPLYMAPEIIQNQKYDGKADLWSVGAVLFQLVTGKPPFNGNSQYQLFQNILTSTELKFPKGCLEELHPDCVDLCRSLLRQKPVERLTFKEFYNHSFLADSRTSLLPQRESGAANFDSCPKEGFLLQLEHPIGLSSKITKLMGSSVHDVSRSDIATEKGSTSLHGSQFADSLESIEKDYVIVNPHFASIENFSCYMETSLQSKSTARDSFCQSKRDSQDPGIAMQVNASSSGCVVGRSAVQRSSSSSLAVLREVQGLSVLHPSTRLHLLYQYILAIAELAQEKYNAGLFMEAFSIELVVLAIWKKAIIICHSWQASAGGNELPSSSTGEFQRTQCNLSAEIQTEIDFSRPSLVSVWVEQGFIEACIRAEKLSDHLRETDDAAVMPDAMEIIFQKALDIGRSGAVDEYMENMGGAAVSYSKALLLFSFIVGEALSLQLNPPFSLDPTEKRRIQSYIINLQTHQSHFLKLQKMPDRTSEDFS